ncbi:MULTISPECIES: hypothetical protein [Clostridium]|uniref:hypothetical protein n=1 Tax=Clostridium TaxID=1485 RepID=UPI000824248A|nr:MULTISPECIES: hypothetical protein [Clostridium]PJI06584.1 hypothetical protein CUB90_01310 [Clostridium sp. CT7]
MNRKLKFIIAGSVVTALFIGMAVFLICKLTYSDNYELNPKKNIQAKVRNTKYNAEDEKENKINVEVRKENKNADKLKKFQSDDSNNVNEQANTSCERQSDGNFYIDNINDLYNNKLVSLDEMFWVQKRLKEAANDMPKFYKETLSIKNNDRALKKYMLKGDNKDRLNYLYGAENVNSIKTLINKLSFIKDNSKLTHGAISNITKQDDNHIGFNISIYSSDNKEQTFNVTLEFKSDRAVLNIKIE